MTESYKTNKFEGISNEKIESHLKQNIVEHINIGKLQINIANSEAFDWLNAHHFDYRKTKEGKTMIEAGLALEALEGMYNQNK